MVWCAPNQEDAVAKLIDTLLLLALPASGKSEVRAYLKSLGAERCRDELGLGETVQLDDYPYVHLMRRIDQELEELSEQPVFFAAQDKPFSDAYDWGTLIALLNEDYEHLSSKPPKPEGSAAQHLFARIDAAREAIGRPKKLAPLSDSVRQKLQSALESECAAMIDEKQAGYPDSLEGKTIVIEFARGGADGSRMPLSEPFGYRYSLSQLSSPLLERASILYVWVTPEESRRKNEERADPNDPGSILHHGVPIDVMMNDYGCDDMTWLIEQAGDNGGPAVCVEKDGSSYRLSVSRVDNRVDKTSFVRKPRAEWGAEEVKALHDELAAGLARLPRK
jgi:hypothetical protein